MHVWNGTRTSTFRTGRGRGTKKQQSSPEKVHDVVLQTVVSARRRPCAFLCFCFVLPSRSPPKMFACSVQCRHLKAAAFFYPYYCSTASYPGMHPWTFDSFSISKKKKSLRLLQNMCVLGTKIKFTFQLITTQKDFISPTY